MCADNLKKTNQKTYDNEHLGNDRLQKIVVSKVGVLRSSSTVLREAYRSLSNSSYSTPISMSAGLAIHNLLCHPCLRLSPKCKFCQCKLNIIYSRLLLNAVYAYKTCCQSINTNLVAFLFLVVHAVHAKLAVLATNVISSRFLSAFYCHLKYLSSLQPSWYPHLCNVYLNCASRAFRTDITVLIASVTHAVIAIRAVHMIFMICIVFVFSSFFSVWPSGKCVLYAPNLVFFML